MAAVDSPTAEIELLSGPAIAPVIPEVARLRVTLFREFPYLYDGSEDYEREYLGTYLRSETAMVVVARAGGRVIGASTALALAEAEPAFREPFGGDRLGDWFYFGESLLEPEWRGRGIGHRFFDEREAFGAARGYGRFAFCAVERPDDHPLRPTGYRSLVPFWEKRGYRGTGRVARLSWKQVDSDGEVENRLRFRVRELPEFPRRPGQM